MDAKIMKRRRFTMFHIKKWIDTFDSWMIAITYAEAGEREMALSALHKRPKKKSLASRARKHADQRPVLRA